MTMATACSATPSATTRGTAAHSTLTYHDISSCQFVELSVFGVGEGTYNDAMLVDLANKGQGVYRFLDSDDEVKRVFVDDAVLCELFERLGGVVEEPKLAFRFLLGLILMRKRLVVYESSRVEEGKEVWTVRPRGREDKLDLVNPKLDEARMVEVSQQLGEILNESL